MRDLAILEIVVVKLIIVALALLGLFWLLKTLLKKAALRKSFRTRLDRIMPSLEGIVWLGFLLWSVDQLIRNEVWTSVGVVVILLLVVVLLFWLVVRDYLAGIILKTDGSVRLNDWIRVKGIEGKITELGNRTMTIVADSGETINVPYNAVSGEISSRPNPGEELINHSFGLKLSKLYDAELTVAQIKRSILNAPWSSVNKNPEIKLINEKPDCFEFDINIYAPGVKYFQKIKKYLIEELEKADYKKIEEMG
jgi:small-conductance mechanosensitive channel